MLLLINSFCFTQTFFAEQNLYLTFSRLRRWPNRRPFLHIPLCRLTRSFHLPRRRKLNESFHIYSRGKPNDKFSRNTPSINYLPRSSTDEKSFQFSRFFTLISLSVVSLSSSPSASRVYDVISKRDWQDCVIVTCVNCFNPLRQMPRSFIQFGALSIVKL